MTRCPTWPEGKRFAFTIFDDTDMATVENTKPVYDFLSSLNIKTTKSIWPMPHNDPKVTWGSSCSDQNYLAWVQSLQNQGFEIGLHNVAATSSERPLIEAGLNKFREFFGEPPKCFANHAECQDSLYWADARFSGWIKHTYNLLTGFQKIGLSKGHVEGSPFFWGDLSKRHIQFVRNFVFSEINTLKACPEMPYHDPSRPFVNDWFCSSNGTDVDTFLQCVNSTSVDQLEAEGGACIIYTHLARGFYQDGHIHPGYEQVMKYLSKKDGWFVPVGTILDFLKVDPTRPPFSDSVRSRLERLWLKQKLYGSPQ